MAEEEKVFVTCRNGNPIRISIANNDDIPTPEELVSFQRGLDDTRIGRVYEMIQNETLDEFLNRVGPCFG